MESKDYMEHQICTPRDPRFIQMLVNEYNTTNISLKDLSKKYHTDAYYEFKIHNIPKRSTGIQKSLTRTNCIDLSWNFESIETEEQAYITGLLFVDGYVNNQQIGLKLKRSDKELVEKIKNYFSPKITLQEDETGYSFVISSDIACKNLKQLGKVKTGEPIHIPQMNKSLKRHFIRGYFDGDGTIFICSNNKTKFFKSNICCVTSGILEEFQKQLQEKDIYCTINKENRKGKTMKIPHGTCVCAFDMYRLYIRRKDSIQRFYHYLYDDCNIFMKRKRKVFEDNKELFVYIKPRKIPS